MLRRIAVTAAVSSAAVSLAALASTPAAALGGVPMPDPGALLAGQDQLTVTVREEGARLGAAEVTYELECGPADGDHPEAEGACARLEELEAEGRDPFAPVPWGAMCTKQYGGPEQARITGIWHGRAVDATFSRTDGCEIARWKTVEPVLPHAGA